jgi:hypothetical protein
VVLNDYHGRTPYKYYKGHKAILDIEGKPKKSIEEEIVAILIVKKW